MRTATHRSRTLSFNLGQAIGAEGEDGETAPFNPDKGNAQKKLNEPTKEQADKAWKDNRTHLGMRDQEGEPNRFFTDSMPLTHVPQWMYDERFLGFSVAMALWVANLVAAISHAVLVVATIVVSSINGKTLETPTVEMFTRAITFNPNSTSMITPSLKPAGWSIPITTFTIAFFGLSCAFHVIVCVLNTRGAFAIKSGGENTKVGSLLNYYYVWINDCKQPFR